MSSIEASSIINVWSIGLGFIFASAFTNKRWIVEVSVFSKPLISLILLEAFPVNAVKANLFYYVLIDLLLEITQ